MSVFVNCARVRARMCGAAYSDVHKKMKKETITDKKLVLLGLNNSLKEYNNEKRKSNKMSDLFPDLINLWAVILRVQCVV